MYSVDFTMGGLLVAGGTSSGKTNALLLTRTRVAAYTKDLFTVFITAEGASLPTAVERDASSWVIDPGVVTDIRLLCDQLEHHIEVRQRYGARGGTILVLIDDLELMAEELDIFAMQGGEVPLARRVLDLLRRGRQSGVLSAAATRSALSITRRHRASFSHLIQLATLPDDDVYEGLAAG
jgi:hypothetical protein